MWFLVRALDLFARALDLFEAVVVGLRAADTLRAAVGPAFGGGQASQEMLATNFTQGR